MLKNKRKKIGCKLEILPMRCSKVQSCQVSKVAHGACFHKNLGCHPCIVGRNMLKTLYSIGSHQWVTLNIWNGWNKNLKFAYNPKQTYNQHFQASPNGKIWQLVS
jgi:hypothetical protein